MLILILILLILPLGQSLTIRGKEIEFSSQGRSLGEIQGVHILHREGSTVESPLIVLAKGYFLIRGESYSPRGGDELTKWTPEMKMEEGLEGPVVVKCAPPICPHHRWRRGNRTDHPKRHTNTLWALNDTSSLGEILQDERVLWVEPHPRIWNHQGPLRNGSRGLQTDLPLSWGEGMIGMISDTGIDPYHCAFLDPLMPTPIQGVITPSSHQKIASLNTVLPGVTDFRGVNGAHGSMTTSVAMGNLCRQKAGRAPSARVAFLDLSPSGTEVLDLPSSFLDLTLLLTSSGGASVHSGSWGGGTPGVYDQLCSEFDQMARKRPGAVFVQSCGNDGTPCASPSSAKNVISVGASWGGDFSFWSDFGVHPERYSQVTIASYSSYGPLKLGRMAPLFWAPGVYVPVAYGFYSPSYGHTDYVLASGTSFSCPNISGLVLEIQRRYIWLFPSDRIGFQLVVPILITISSPMDKVMFVNDNSGAVPVSRTLTPQNSGYGSPDLPLDPEWLPVILNKGTVTNSQGRASLCYSLGVNGTFWAKAAMAWVDLESPSGVQVSSLLINDLDWRMFSERGEVLEARRQGNVNNHDVLELNLTGPLSFRFVIYEKDGVILGGDSQEFGFAMNIKGDPLITQYECGGCFPEEYLSCEGGGFRACNLTSGEFEDVCRTSKAPGFQEGMSFSCETSFFQGINNGTGCEPRLCKSYYFWDGEQCTCLEGTQRGSLEVCSGDGTFKAVVLSSATSPVIGRSQNGALGTNLSSLLLLVLFSLTIVTF